MHPGPGAGNLDRIEAEVGIRPDLMAPVKCLPVLLLAVVAAGCAAKVQARVPEPPMPTLEAPPAPPRIIAVYEEPAAPDPPAEVAVEGPPAPVRPPARPPRPEPTEAPVAEPPRIHQPSPPLTLTPTPGSEAQTEASIRTLLSRASRDLSRVNAATLNIDGRTQFDTARRFMQQAEESLKARNLVFAGKLADKAAAMASVLVR
jgi:type IV secretory pathway VirB10-like protein